MCFCPATLSGIPTQLYSEAVRLMPSSDYFGLVANFAKSSLSELHGQLPEYKDVAFVAKLAGKNLVKETTTAAKALAETEVATSLVDNLPIYKFMASCLAKEALREAKDFLSELPLEEFALSPGAAKALKYGIPLGVSWTKAPVTAKLALGYAFIFHFPVPRNT